LDESLPLPPEPSDVVAVPVGRDESGELVYRYYRHSDTYWTVAGLRPIAGAVEIRRSRN
jgi:hypothetical protein